MGYRVYRVDPELERLIDDCLDLRVKVSLSTDDDSAELQAMRREIYKLEKCIDARQQTTKNPTPDHATA